jgi:acetyl-CoA synthetase
MTSNNPQATETFRAARDFLIEHRTDYDTAYRDFQWPQMPEFNWALDWFDVLAAEQGDDRALWVVEEDQTETILTFADLAARSDQVANWLRSLGVRRGDRVLVSLGNCVPLWEITLAVIKLGAVLIPATTLLTADDIADRVVRGEVRHVVAHSGDVPKFEPSAGQLTRIAVGPAVDGWVTYADSHNAATNYGPDGITRADDPLLLYFTSGTTAAPKLVRHTQTSYPVGHLSTMYWIGIQRGDVHLNISSPGWAKHAWSSLFAPWNAGACVLVINQARFAAAPLLTEMQRCGVTTFCAPPTVWRLLIQADLSAWSPPLREVVGAGEPLNPEVIEQVRNAWGVTIRDGYGQTETTAQIGNSPGQPVHLGSMGRPLPGYVVRLIDPVTGDDAEEGEICLDLSLRPLALMTGYQGDTDRDAAATAGGVYHTGDVAQRGENGYITYVGRADDVFKASDYRISPFELESVLIEHEAVAEAAVVPSPDPMRLAVPKAYVALTPGHEANAETAESILRFARERLAPYKRVRRLEFAELPKTISGKIRRVELRLAEEDRHRAGSISERAAGEYWEQDFPA